jgi:hypothetical protein
MLGGGEYVKMNKRYFFISKSSNIVEKMKEE